MFYGYIFVGHPVESVSLYNRAVFTKPVSQCFKLPAVDSNAQCRAVHGLKYGGVSHAIGSLDAQQYVVAACSECVDFIASKESS